MIPFAGIGAQGEPDPDPVFFWNEVIQTTARADSLQASPTRASRAMAMTHVAMADAYNAIDRRFVPYAFDQAAPPGADPRAAIAQAAYETLRAVYPTQVVALDHALSESLALVPAGAALEAGRMVGRAAAAAIVARRAGDGAAASPDYEQRTAPGAWRPTPPDFSIPTTPHWGNVRPFVMTRGDQFRTPPPPALDSAEYAANLDELRRLGARGAGERTAAQTETGLFWAYDRLGMGPPLILYNALLRQVARARGNSLAENARLFALANLALADAAIACWESKYHYNLWRPVTAIRRAADDGNPATLAVTNWYPLGAPGGGIFLDYTPPFPSYPSGHSTLGGALGRVIARFYGTDQIAFTLESGECPGVVRRYGSVGAAMAENAASRVYLGVHYAFDCSEGMAQGEQVADYVYEHALAPSTAAQRAWRAYH